jgi:hypothetical protein
MDIDLTKKLREKMGGRPRVRGRYNSSELYFINNGSVSPEQWLHQSEKPMKDILNMWNGIGIHNQLEDLLGKEHSEKKVEFVYKNLVLVGKVDFMPPDKIDEIWEFKTSERKMEKSKPWQEHQVRLYCTMFNKKQGLIYQPIKDSNGIYLKHLGTIERDDKWFEEEMEKLHIFHLKVEDLWKKNENI